MDQNYDKPSTYTILYWLVQEKKVESNVFFYFLDLFWPKFIEKDDYVFLKEKYSEKEFIRLVNEGANPEYWLNLFTVNDFFEEAENADEKSELLAYSLVEIWGMKLKKSFPDKNFIVQYLCDKEYGDYGLTFYQKK